MSVPPFYSIEVITPSGETVDTIDNPISLVAARSYTAVGSAILTILPDYDEEFFRYNMRFKLWRTDSVYGKSLFGDTVWFLRKFIHNVSQQNFAIEMADALTLLSNPVVAYTAQTPYADKTLEELGDITYDDFYRIDNLMKEYVRENFASGALDVARNNPFIVVEQNRNLAPFGEKTASWAKLSSVLSDLARMSAEKGMELFYDLIPQSNNTFLFKVWRDIRGVDRGFNSAASLIFSDENGDLDDVQVSYDYSQMATYCYVLGYDTGPSQVIVEIGNTAIIESDPFGRIEFTTNSTDNDVSSVLLADGQAALFGLRPRRILSAKLSAASSLRYGTDFAYGDRIGVQVGGRRYDCQISAVRAEWRDARETLDIRLDGSESLWNPTYWEGSDRTPTPIVTPVISYDVPPVPPVGPPSFGDPSIFFGDMQGFVLWDGGRVFRTWNLLDTFPLWSLIDDGVDGNIFDCQYVVIDADTMGAWLMTSTGIWWCADILAEAVVWVEKLAIETVQAADAVPTTGVVGFKTMFHAWTSPGHLCVATGPVAGFDQNTTYEHAYFWVTENYGTSWTQVDMNAFIYTGGGGSRGFCYASLYSMNIYRSSPNTIYCIRTAPQAGLNGKTQVFLSSDLGYTWTEGDVLEENSSNDNIHVHSLLNPFPDADDPSYAVQGGLGASNRPSLWKSTDGWATSSEIAKPAGYGGFSNFWRVNKHTFNNLHIIAWLRHTAENQMHLMETTDGGTTWQMLVDSGVDDTSISNTPLGIVVNAAQWNTPNGWPPDINQWVVVRAADGPIVDSIRLTLNNFTALSDKSGDLATFGDWIEGPADGFALPKIARNGDAPPDTNSHILVRAALSAASSAGATTLDVASTGIVEGDLILLHVGTVDDVTLTSIPAGFTLLSNGEITGGPTIRVYSKVATGSEPANYTVNTSAGTRISLGWISIYADIAGTVTLDASANQTASLTEAVFPSVTTTVPYTLLTCFASIGSFFTVTAKPGMVKQYPAGGGRFFAITQATTASVGPTGTRSATDADALSNVRAVTAAWKVV